MLGGQSLPGGNDAVTTVRTLLGILSLIPSEFARANEVLREGPRPGSIAASDARRPLGNLPSTLAGQNLSVAFEHLITWRELLAAQTLPAFAHMSLLRCAFEGAATVHWLVEAGVDATIRVQRGAVMQLEDYRNRREFEKGRGIQDGAFTGRAKSGSARYEEHQAKMAAAQIPGSPRVPTATRLVDQYGAGAWAYQLTSGFAHRKQWSLLF